MKQLTVSKRNKMLGPEELAGLVQESERKEQKPNS